MQGDQNYTSRLDGNNLHHEIAQKVLKVPSIFSEAFALGSGGFQKDSDRQRISFMR